MTGGRITNDLIARCLLEHVPLEVVADLRSGDSAAAIELYFDPVRVQALTQHGIASGDACSTDGFYEATLDAERPWIFYAKDVSPSRARFTLLHELGHHLLATVAAELLDPIDQLGPDAQAAEEQVCHAFAGLILVPDHLVPEGPITPDEVLRVKESSGASWEATAVRLVTASPNPVAIVLVREQGTVALGVASRSLGSGWWDRGADLDRHGPMWNALSRDIVAQRDTYRFALAGAQSMFVDSRRAHRGLAVAVLSRTASDGHFEVLVEPEPRWKDDVATCLFCPGDRGTGWCGTCSGRLCDECARCGCAGSPVEHARCPECGRREPHRSGATMCRTCEADLL